MSDQSAFERLDERARSRASGYLLVHADEPLLGTVARHLARRSRAVGRSVVCVDDPRVDEPWRELAKRLQIVGDDPSAVARGLLARIDHGAAFVCIADTTHWGAAVADELARIMAAKQSSGWLVELTPRRRSTRAGEEYAVERQASPRDLDRWLEARWQAERKGGPLAELDQLDDLEHWWGRVREVSDAGSEAGSSAEAERLLARLTLARRRLTSQMLRSLGSPAACERLARRGLVQFDDDGWVALRAVSSSGGDRADALAVADCLRATGVCWDGMRAAELLADAGELPAAAELATAALSGVGDACGRADLWRRWDRVLRAADSPPAKLLLDFSELALQLGDIDPAVELAQRSAADDGERFETLLGLGRATAARGDFTAATLALEQAAELAPGAEGRARALVELAEVCCGSSEVAQARELATTALQDSSERQTQLAARNVLGKLLLAAGAWQQAQEHFAADAHDAACADLIEAELRARMNHASALMASGRHTEARARFRAVLDSAERSGVLRATAFALSNLAVLASNRHDYAEALRLRERSFQTFRRIGNRKWLARSMTYLADLRLELGLIDEADQALAFTRRMLGQVVPPTQAAWMGSVASRIHLARGDTAKAAAAIDDAISSAARSTDGSMLSDCHCQAARVALADGDFYRAEDALEGARGAAKGASTETELALLDAAMARASGRPSEAHAQRGMELARRAGDRARQAEAHLCLYHAAVARGDAAEGRAQLDAASKLHDAIAESLPVKLRERYRARIQDAGLHNHGGTGRDDAGAAGSRCDDIVGSHPTMQRLFHVITKVAPTDATLLVTGESGTGKELVADAVHRRSGRKDGPLVKVNCAALVETLLLSELFGHEKGAFTGATSRRRGCFEHADGGTVFLDEIGDISEATQAALLRVLQDHTFHRVGGTEPVRVDVRVICATHRDLAAMVKQGRFREDLYYRLCGVVLELPPLRERIEDLPLLVSKILLSMARQQDTPLKRLSPAALDLLARHDWRGNVRELQNVLRSAALFCDGEVIDCADLARYATGLPDHERPADDAPQPHALPLEPSADTDDLVYAAVRGGVGLRALQKQLELHCIVRALAETNGHVTRAAALLGIKRPRLSQLIKQHDLQPNQKSTDEAS